MKEGEKIYLIPVTSITKKKGIYSPKNNIVPAIEATEDGIGRLSCLGGNENTSLEDSYKKFFHTL